ncbi:hypothetical protein KKC16_02030, partial [Patescibacteria group bacterium]|nr:hypothetical protein [Patescibacteria group bacterium]
MNYLNIIKNNWQTIIVITLVMVILSLVLSIIRPLEYRTRVDLLIISKQSANMDAYQSARASEKLAQTLASVIKTKSFLNQVLQTNFGIAPNALPKDEKELRQVWQNKINAQLLPESSILRVDVYDKSKIQSNKISKAVAYVLTNQANEYYGNSSDISIKIVNESLTSRYPVRPNIILNLILGCMIGLILNSANIFYKLNKLKFY